MSMTPQEVPQHEVQHDVNDDGWVTLPGDFYVGRAEHSREWSSDEAIDEWEQDMDRRTESRQRLGGFGFGAGHGV